MNNKSIEVAPGTQKYKKTPKSTSRLIDPTHG